MGLLAARLAKTEGTASFDEGYKKERPPDRALVMWYEGRCQVLDHIGPDLDYVAHIDMLSEYLNSDLEECASGLSGVLVWEGKLHGEVITNWEGGQDCDEWLEGTARLATKEEWRACVDGEYSWEVALWKEMVAIDIETLPTSPGLSQPRCTCDNFCDSPCPEHASAEEITKWDGGLGDLSNDGKAHENVMSRLSQWKSPADARMVALALLLTPEEYQRWKHKGDLPTDYLTRTTRPDGASIGRLSSGLCPDPSKPFEFDSLVEQYSQRAREVHMEMGWDVRFFKSLAELWATTDLEIIRVFMENRPGLTREEAIATVFRTSAATSPYPKLVQLKPGVVEHLGLLPEAHEEESQ